MSARQTRTRATRPGDGNGELAGWVALVTGAGRRDGIGHAVGRRLAREGADIVAVDQDRTEFGAVRIDIERLGRRCLTVAADVTDPGAVDALVRRTVEVFGRLDVLVNNAGGSWGVGGPLPPGPRPGADFVGVTNCTREQWRAIVGVNLDAGFYCAQAAASQFIRQRHGIIVNVASIAARRGVYPEASDSSGPYAVAKAGLIGLTKQLALELAPYNVRVNAVAPGLIASGRGRRMVDALSASGREARLRGIPLGRLGTVEEVAGLVVALCSGVTSYMTGTVLDVNGGAYLA